MYEDISDADLELMKQVIASRSGSAEGHADAEQDIEQLKPLIEAVQFLAGQLETFNDRLEKLEKVVLEDIVGGITDLYKKNQRESSIAGLKEKYGSLFDPHKDALEAFYPGVDIYDKIQDMLEQMKGEDGFTEEAFDGSVREAVKELQDRIGKLTGKQDQDSGNEVPAVAIEVETKSEPVSEEDDKIAKTLEAFKAMREKAPKGLFSK